MRNLANATSDAYNRVSSDNEEFRLREALKDVVQTMPLFTDTVSSRLAEKEADTVRAATLSSVYAEIAQGGEKDLARILAFFRTQKKDALCDVIPRH